MFFLVSINPYSPATAVICITGEADRDKCIYPWIRGIGYLILAVNEILDIDSIVNIEKSEFSFVFVVCFKVNFVVGVVYLPHRTIFVKPFNGVCFRSDIVGMARENGLEV